MPREQVSQDFFKFRVAHYSQIAKLYKVSLLATLTRLVELGLISEPEYDDESFKLKNKERVKLQTKVSKSSGGPVMTAAKRALKERGEEFVSLVLENADRGYITRTDVLDFLNVKTRHLKELDISM